MGALVWLIAYIVGFGLLQLLLYRYFQRDDPTPETTPSSTDGSAAVSTFADDDGTGIRCRECGAHNEKHAMIAYCRECTSRLC